MLLHFFFSIPFVRVSSAGGQKPLNVYFLNASLTFLSRLYRLFTCQKQYGNPRSMSSNSLAHMASPTKSSPDKRGSKRSAALQLQSPHIPQTPSGVGYFNTFGTPAGQDHSMGRDLFASNSFGGFSINDGEVGSPSQHWDTGLGDWRPEISGGQRRYGGDIASPFPTADMFNMSPIGSGGASTLLGSPVVDSSMGIYRPTHVASPSGRIPRPDLAPVPMLSGSSVKTGKSKAKTQSKRKKVKSPTRRSAPTPRSLHRSSSPESSAAFPPHSSVNPLASPIAATVAAPGLSVPGC